MVVSVSLLATVAAGLVAAAPSTRIGTPKINGFLDGRMSVEQVRNEKYKFNGAVSVYKTHLKFKAAVPDYLLAAVANYTSGALGRRASTQGSVSNSPIDSSDDAYISPVSIGTPPQTLYLDFDTGSSDLWVFSSETPSSEVQGQTVYKPGSSSTAKKLSGYTWQISYGDGSSSSGDVYTDVVTIGGVTVKKQAVESAQKVSSTFTSDSSTDGLLGLAFDSINTVSPTAQPTFFDNILSSLSSPVFTADLKHQAPGTYNFGYIDDDAYTGSITYTDVTTSQGFWEWTSTGYSIGSASFVSTSIDGIADTGTTLLYLPSSIVKAYYKKVKGSSSSSSAGGYIFPCTATLPTFSFGVGDATITIPAEYMSAGPVDSSGTSCFGGLQSSSSIGINIFGDVALKAAFVVFNGGSSPSLGWAPKNT